MRLQEGVRSGEHGLFARPAGNGLDWVARPVVGGGVLRDLRQWARLSRRQVAARLGVCRQTIGNWERGDSRMPFPAYWYLCLILGCPLPGGPWAGWVLYGGVLVSPAGETFEPHELSWLSLVFARARAWDRQQALVTAGAVG